MAAMAAGTSFGNFVVGVVGVVGTGFNAGSAAMTGAPAGPP
jgi:hypothetical protein